MLSYGLTIITRTYPGEKADGYQNRWQSMIRMIAELVAAAESLGYQVEKDQINDGARFPKRPHIKSGYIMISKNESLKNKDIKGYR